MNSSYDYELLTKGAKYRAATVAMILLCFFCFCIIGCTPRYQIVEKTQYVYVPISAALMTPIVPVRPPEKDAYLKATPEEQRALLTAYSMDLLKTTRDLNSRLQAISSLDRSNRTLVETANQKEAERVNKLVNDSVKALQQPR